MLCICYEQFSISCYGAKISINSFLFFYDWISKVNEQESIFLVAGQFVCIPATALEETLGCLSWQSLGAQSFVLSLQTWKVSSCLCKVSMIRALDLIGANFLLCLFHWIYRFFHLNKIKTRTDRMRSVEGPCSQELHFSI